MLMCTTFQRYRKCHGKLRSLPSHPHSHLKLVEISGFYGQKAQLELALHILRNSAMLKAMKIHPKPTVTRVDGSLFMKDGFCFVDGYKVAKKYLRKADHHGVLSVIKVRRRDVEGVNPHHLIDPYWIDALAEDVS